MSALAAASALTNAVPTVLSQTIGDLAQAAADSCDDAATDCVLGIDVQTILRASISVLLILIFTFLLSRILRRVVGRAVRRGTLRGIAKLGDVEARARAELRATTLSGVMAGTIGATIWVTGLVMIMAEVGLQIGPLIAGAGIVGVALGFGAQSLVKDFFSGFFILLEDQYGIGDVVDAGGQAVGTVEEITLRVTRLRSMDGTVWFVPNGEIRQLGNKTKEYSQAVFDIGIDYKADIDTATEIMRTVAADLAADPEFGVKLRDDLKILGVDQWGESSVVIKAVLRTGPTDRWPVQREYQRRLKYAFDAAGIEIPFPHRKMIMSTEPAPVAKKAPAKKKTAAKKRT